MKANDREFFYMMLNRLENDCRCFLALSGNEKQLWAKNVKDQIKKMKEIYGLFLDSEKPEWISIEKINEYEKLMTNRLETLKNEYTWTAVVKSRRRVTIPKACWEKAGFPSDPKNAEPNKVSLVYPYTNSIHWVGSEWLGVTYNNKNNGLEGNVYRLVVPFEEGTIVRLIPNPKTNEIKVKPIDYDGQDDFTIF